MNIGDDAVPIRKLDDGTLVQKFVEGESSLLSNQSLRVETSFDAVALMAKKEGVVATIKVVDGKRIVLVRAKSQFWQLVHQALLVQGFVPNNYPDQQGFIQYQQHEVPPGYQVNYAEARFLWKEWWVQRRKYTAQSIQLDLLIFTRGKWYPIREIISNEGVLFITTLVGDTILSGSDQVAWLSRVAKTAPPVGVVSQIQAKRAIQPNQTDLDETTVVESERFPAPGTKPAPRPGVDGTTAAGNGAQPGAADGTPPRPPFIPGVTGRGVGAARVPIRPTTPLTGRPSTRKLPQLDLDSVTPSPPVGAVPATEQAELTVAERIPYEEHAAQSFEPTLTQSASPEPEVLPVAVSASTSQSYPDVSPLLDLGAVLRFGDGRLYISTAIGELVVEGTDLKFWLTRGNPSA